MQAINNAMMYCLSFKSYVVLPVIIFTLAMIFRIKFQTAIKASLQIGIGFIGIFMVFDYFIKVITPVVQALINRMGLHCNVLDVGWPPYAAMTWSFKLTPLLLTVLIATNLIMLALKLTKTVDIDIWNYWHIIFTGAMVYYATGNLWLTLGLAVLIFVGVLKLAEWSAPLLNRYTGMSGICIPHMSSITYLPLAVLGNKVLDQIPVVNRINANPEAIRNKLGLLGEPMMLGLAMGAALGIGGGYPLKDVADLAFRFAAVIYILPMMCNILGTSLIPISEGMKAFIQRYLPGLGETYIGLDVAVVLGNPAVVVSGLLLIPTALILAFVLPGIRFIPLGDLPNVMIVAAFLCVVTNGNVVRTYLIGLPIIIALLYLASNLAGFYTKLASFLHYRLPGYDGVYTSFLDGGNLLRGWLIYAVTGNLPALLLIPVVIGLVWYTRQVLRREIQR